MKHPTKIEKYNGSLEELAEDIGNLRYDALRDLMKHLSKKIHDDAQADSARGRKKLALYLNELCRDIMKAEVWAKMAWIISKPHMDLEDETKSQD